MGYFEYDFKDIDEANKRHRFWRDIEPFATVIAVLLILMFMACMTSCRNTRVLSSQEHASVSHEDTTSHSVVSVMYTDIMRKAIDSLYHKQSVLDSLIESTRESLTIQSALHRSDSTYVSDSMSIDVDSSGIVRYHYYHNIYKETKTHDTLYVNSSSTHDKARLTILSDSLSRTHVELDSILQSYARLDSTYQHLRDSITHAENTVVEKQVSNWLQTLYYVLIALTICAVTLGICKLFRWI